MSGGHWNYNNITLCNEIFGWASDAREAAFRNPLDDRLISEITWDLFEVLHQYDLYRSGDTDEEKYRDAARRFKNKWIHSPHEGCVLSMIDSVLADAKADIFRAFDFGNVVKTDG